MARVKPVDDDAPAVFPGREGDPTLGGAIRPEMFDALQASYRPPAPLPPGDTAPDPAPST